MLEDTNSLDGAQIGSIHCQLQLGSNDEQEQIFEGISEIRGGLSKKHVWPLNIKISLHT